MPVIAFQMDPLENIDIHGDSSFVLMYEAQKRGYQLFHYTPDMLNYHKNTVYAQGAFVTVEKTIGNHFQVTKKATINLADDCDVIWLRQDPPFDMSYITSTHLLELVMDKTLIVNNPISVRNAPEKLLPLIFHDMMPATLISRNIDEIKNFRANYNDIIIKPLFGNGGVGVFHLTQNDENLSTLCELFFSQSREPIMIQEYLPAVKQGDKRVILCDGEPIAAINRIPPIGEARSNMHVGGVATASILTKNDQKICDNIGGYLKDKGLLFVGIDIIGDYLTEINVTSPTGLQEANRFDNQCYEAIIWDKIDTKLTYT